MTQNGSNGDFTLHVANVRGRMSNTSYPFEAKIACVDDLVKAAQYDHVSARYKDSRNKAGAIVKAHRAKADFIEADNICLDCDNKQTNPVLPDIPPELWKSPDDVQAAFPGVAFYAIPSRHHMKEKDGLPARPKYHYYFKLKQKATNGAAWAALKARVQAYFPAFDDGAIDAARFMYGVENPQPVFYDGDLCIDEFMEQLAADAKQAQAQSAAQAPKYTATIPVGQRNNTLSRFAALIAVFL